MRYCALVSGSATVSVAGLGVSPSPLGGGGNVVSETLTTAGETPALPETKECATQSDSLLPQLLQKRGLRLRIAHGIDPLQNAGGIFGRLGGRRQLLNRRVAHITRACDPDCVTRRRRPW